MLVLLVMLVHKVQLQCCIKGAKGIKGIKDIWLLGWWRGMCAAPAANAQQARW
jgi:hypothetical protein